MIQAFNDWLALHQQWIFIAAFTSALVESFAIIGVIVPGVALLFGIALVAASSGVEIGPLLLATLAGAVAGDGTSFFIGRHFHEKLRQFPPFTTHPKWIEKGENFFLKHGAVSIVAGRFVGPLRPLIPMVAGMFQMSPTKFISINVLSAVAWAPTYIVPGFLVGLSFDEDYGLQRQHTVFILGLILFIWIANITLKKTLQLFASAAQTDTTPPILSPSVRSLIVFLLCTSLFIFLAITVKFELMTGIDNWVHEQFIALRHPWLDPFVIALTEFGNIKPMLLCGSFIVIFLLTQRCWSGALSGAIIIISSPLVIFGLKEFLGVVRPNVIIAPPASLAFPSGHATMITLLGGFMAFILLRHTETKHHGKITQFAVALVALISISRLYLGVHWFSDILGGLLLASAMLGLAQFIYFQLPEKKISASRTMLGMAAAMLLSAGLYVAPNHSAAMMKFKPLNMAKMNPLYQHNSSNEKLRISESIPSE